MSFSYRIRRKLIRGVALGFAVAVVAAPSALAMGPGAIYQQDGAGLAAGSAYGPLHQFPNAGLAVARAYGPLHQFPRAGITAGNPPVFSVDGPRTGPANVTESPVVGGRFGRPDLAPNTGTSGVEIAWPEVGTGLGIGVAVALGLTALGFGMMRRRGTLQSV